MPPGRPRLPPEVKKEHIARSRKQYEEKNADKRRDDARLRMRRRRAAIQIGDPATQHQYRRKAAEASERYRDKVRARDLAAAKAARVLQRQAQWHELRADNLRRKHQALVESQRKSDPIGRTSSEAKKKAKRLAPLSKEPHRSLQLASPFQNPSSPSPLPRLRRASSPLPRSLMDIDNQADEDSSDSDCDTQRPRVAQGPIFERRVVNNIPRDFSVDFPCGRSFLSNLYKMR
ncbi:hypothetical protein C8R45DRAFT_1113399 [Mycena sanguinolenta]|nr:hypothetical protein C8R45DRAFT_1113399 [Mycena sanguinolenta]